MFFRQLESVASYMLLHFINIRDSLHFDSVLSESEVFFFLIFFLFLSMILLEYVQKLWF